METKLIPRTPVTTIETTVQTNSELSHRIFKQMMDMITLAEKCETVVEIRGDRHEVYSRGGEFKANFREYTAMFERKGSGVFLEYNNQEPGTIYIELCQGEDQSLLEDIKRGIRTYLENQRLV